MHERKELRWTFLECGRDLCRIDNLAWTHLDCPHVGTGAARHLGQPLAEIPCDCDDRAVSFLEEIHHDRLEPG